MLFPYIRQSDQSINGVREWLMSHNKFMRNFMITKKKMFFLVISLFVMIQHRAVSRNIMMSIAIDGQRCAPAGPIKNSLYTDCSTNKAAPMLLRLTRVRCLLTDICSHSAAANHALERIHAQIHLCHLDKSIPLHTYNSRQL